MATEYIADDSSFDGTVWDGQTGNLQASAFATRAVGVANRGGVLPSAGAPLSYVANGDMTGTLKAGAYWLPNASPFRGGYLVVVPTDQVFTHPTAASSARTDYVIVEVADTGVAATSFKKVRLLTVASGGGAPVLPSPVGVGGSVILHSVPVAANATAIGAPADLRTYTAAAGGALRFATRALAEAANLAEGTPVYIADQQRYGYRGPSGIQLAGPPRLRQKIGGSGYSGGSIGGSPDPQPMLVRTLNLTNCLKGSLIEVEFHAVLSVPTAGTVFNGNTLNGAGFLTASVLGEDVALDWHTRDSPERITLFGVVKANIGADGTAVAQLVLTLNPNLAVTVTILNNSLRIRELN